MLATLKQGDGRYLAVKIIKKSSLIDEESLEHVLSENRVLQTLDHPFLVKLYCSFQSQVRSNLFNSIIKIKFIHTPKIPVQELMNRGIQYSPSPEIINNIIDFWCRTIR
jgi:serine/threonine kinase 38